GGKDESETGAGAFDVFEHDTAAVFAHDVAHGRQADAGAFLAFRAEEGFKDPRAVLLGDAWPRIAKGEANHSVLGPGADMDLARFLLGFHGLARVDDQVKQRLAQQHEIAVAGRNVRGERFFDADALAYQDGLGDIHARFHDIVKADRRERIRL